MNNMRKLLNLLVLYSNKEMLSHPKVFIIKKATLKKYIKAVIGL